MKQALQENTEITLCETGTDKQLCFKILNIIGMGASCIVYTASYTDSEGNTFTVRLKECYPSGLEITRNSAMELVVPEKCNDAFEKYTQRFTDGYRRQLKFRQNPESMNSISNIQGIFEGNNTKYIVMSCQNGISIDETELSLYDIFRVLKAVTVQIDNFHKNNFLYLDLKPENVILYPETPELVMLFDFDSAVEIHELSRENLSCTEKWSAPETVQKKMKNIDVRSDIYTLGALLMYMLLGRNPELTDRRRNADWTDEFQNNLLADESPETKRMVTEIFKKTLSANPDSRYSSCSELLEVIEPFIQSFQKQEPYLKTVLPIGNNYFCGRDREISDIHNILNTETSLLVLHGIGGIGKSELAKHYAMKYSDSYDAVIFVRYDSSIIETVASDSGFPVVNCSRCDDESDEDYFKRKISILQKICTPRHLVILDNFDTDECENLDELTSLNCKFLITSRVDFEGIFPQYEIGVLKDINSILSIFDHYCESESDKYTEKIIYALEGHTMAVGLVARQIKLLNKSSKEMYEMLCENGISSSDEKVKNFKDGSLKSKSVIVHMKIMFDVFSRSEEMRNLLCYMAMIGNSPVSREKVISLCEFDADEVCILNRAVREGWIQENGYILQVHSLITEVLISQLDPDVEKYWRLEKNITETAEILDTLCADERHLYENIMLHMAEHIHGEKAILIYFFKTAAKVCEERCDYARAEDYTLKYMEMSEEYYPDDTTLYQYEYLLLADLARRQGENKRADYYMRKAEEVISENEILEEQQLQSYLDMDYESSVEQALQMLDNARTSRDYYNAYSALALTEESYGGDTDKIKEYGREELKYAKILLEENKDNNAETLISLSEDIALAYLHCHEPDKAVTVMEKAVKFMEENLLSDNVDAIITFLLLGKCYAFAGMTDNMLEAMKCGIEIIERHFDSAHPKRIEYYRLCCSVFSAAYQINEDDIFIAEQISLMKKIIYILEEMEDYEELAATEINYANLLLTTGDDEECIKHMFKSLEYYESVFEENAPELIIPLMEIWQNLLLCGYSDYEEIFNRTIKLCEVNGLENEAEENRNLLYNMINDIDEYK